MTYNPTSINSICNVIMNYDKNGGRPSELKVSNKLDELVDMIIPSEEEDNRELWLFFGGLWIFVCLNPLLFHLHRGEYSC